MKRLREPRPDSRLVALLPHPTVNGFKSAWALSLVLGACLAAVVAPQGAWSAMLAMGCLVAPVAWALLVSQSRSLWLDSERRLIVVRWRSALLAQCQAELPLERFSHVASYHLFREWPRVVVTLVERSGDRELVVAALPGEFRRRGFWSSPRVVEGRAAKRLRTVLSARLGIPDGGYKGVRPRLMPSES